MSRCYKTRSKNRVKSRRNRVRTRRNRVRTRRNMKGGAADLVLVGAASLVPLLLLAALNFIPPFEDAEEFAQRYVDFNEDTDNIINEVNRRLDVIDDFALKSPCYGSQDEEGCDDDYNDDDYNDDDY